MTTSASGALFLPQRTALLKARPSVHRPYY
uniref:Uncharacterized protein n=1 Tax=Anguilla anguilla TaxID=7936 RepID=A0A0E9UN57_ANGAN